MSFFDNIGESISKTSQIAIQKTKNFTDTAKLNSQIADLKRKLNNYYSEIGKLYIDIYKGKYDEDIKPIVENITGIICEIERLNNEISEINGLTKCSKCGALNPNNTSFCGSCGNKLDVDLGVRCTVCNSVVPQDAVFCTSCGNKLQK